MNARLPIFRSGNYNILLVPEDHREIKKFRFTARQIRLFGTLLFAAAAFGLLSLVGFLHYRSLYLGFEKERRANLEFARERGDALEKMRSLEAVVGSAEKYADNLAALVGTERPELRKGVGAVKGIDRTAGRERLTWDDISRKMDTLHERARSVDLRIQDLVQVQKNKLLYLASTPSIWPVKGWVTSEFGYRRSPITNERDFHEGIDIASHWGTSVIAPAAGIVAFAGYRGGLGRSVVIDHGFGIRSYFGHASAVLVREGEVITRGTQVARVGNSGHSTGPHLHYEIHVDGVPIDPMKYILQ